ncbi:MAG: hypothetical protein K9G46_11840 [Flavobacteriales bacterium]|nr:hypothetical protein [Flavobacteriales bacterium]
MSYTPNYQFINHIHVDLIGMTKDSTTATLLIRIVDKDGISDRHHLFCEFDQVGSLLLQAGSAADPVIDALAQILSKKQMDEEESIDIHDILGEPLDIQGKCLRVYVPKMEIGKNIWVDQDKDFLILDKILPRKTKLHISAEIIRIQLKNELDEFERTMLFYRKLRLGKAEKSKLKDCQLLIKSNLLKIAQLSKKYMHITEPSINNTLS